ncbi:MAG: DegT/DnrJ/EryC1/StrS family aminotransferase [Bacteroidales bacterium]|nr:DegT/DnrJ/EryC1/StrS family aminotransferase [Bacteroidales bacterium]
MIPIAKACLDGNEKKYLQECVDTEWISSAGKFVDQFESLNAEFYKTKYAVAVSNGTVAIHLALLALGIKAGDEVIVPDFTFAATANAVLYIGAKPILCDVKADTWNIDINKCKSLISDKTRAIIPVHVYGQACDMDEIMTFAKENSLFVIEDCAEAHGAEYKGQKVGSFGDIACFSFFGNKIITTGEGGICTTNSYKLNEKMRVLRDHGMNKQKRYFHDEVGYNYRMTNMQAAVGVAQMENVNIILKKRKEIEAAYSRILKKSEHIELRKKDDGKVNWLYSFLVKNANLETITEIQQELKKEGIDSRPFFFPMHTMPPYKDLKKTDLENSISIASRGLSLPTYNQIEIKTVEHIAKTVVSIIEKLV